MGIQTRMHGELDRLTRQAKLLEYANTKRNNGDFNDVTIQVGAESISAHRMVLSCYSKYFESMFSSQLNESYQKTVKLEEIDGKATKTVIDYIYSGKIEINESNVTILLATVDYLQVDDMKILCFDYLETSLTIESCLDVIRVSVLYGYPSTLQHTYNFISERFEKIMETDKFKELSKQDLTTLFASLEGTNVQETSLYTATIIWVKHDQKREAEFSSLFLNLNLQNLPSVFVLKTVAEEPLVKERLDCINAAIFYYKLNAKDEKKHVASKILSLGGYRKKSALEVYNTSGISYSLYPELPHILSSHCSLKFEDFIYCIGGVVEGNDSKPTNKVYQLNLKAANAQWKEIASMTEQRYSFGAAVWECNLVAAGGYKRETLSSTELYDPSLNRWRNIAPMIKVRDEHALVVADNKLFAIGGSDDTFAPIASVEQLDKLDGTWKEIESMNMPRSCLAAAVCNNSIYAIGGWSQGKPQNTVEKYHLKDHIWRYVSDMNVKRKRHAACVLEGKIFVVGGVDAQHNTVKTIECYDPTADEWTIIDETEEFHDHALVAL